MFFTRLISGIGLLIVAVLAFYIGNLPLIILSALISIIGLFEFYRALDLDKKNIAYLGYVYSLIYYYLICFKLNQYIFRYCFHMFTIQEHLMTDSIWHG